jgi:hypothetical protein
MPKYSEEELDRMSGQTTALARPKLLIPEIRFSGKDGSFMISRRPENWQSGMPYEEEQLGNHVEITILRVKRFLADKDNIYFTDEFDSPKEIIDLKMPGRTAQGRYKVDLIKSAPAESLAKDPEFQLKSNAHVYVICKNELMSIKVKSQSLFNDFEDAQGLYNYVSTFNRELGERAYKFITISQVYGPLTGPKGNKYFIQSFSRDRVLTEEELIVVGDNLLKIEAHYKDLKQFKAQFNEKNSNNEPETTSVTETEELPIIQVETEEYISEPERPTSIDQDIKVEDIPF